MRLNEIEYGDALPIDAYGAGFFRVSGDVVKGDICLLPSGLSTWGGTDDIAEILKAAKDIDVLFVGTGAEMRPLPPAFTTALETLGVGVEPMATPSACRTYNILLSEGRRVGAALFAL